MKLNTSAFLKRRMPKRVARRTKLRARARSAPRLQVKRPMELTVKIQKRPAPSHSRRKRRAARWKAARKPHTK